MLITTCDRKTRGNLGYWGTRITNSRHTPALALLEQEAECKMKQAEDVKEMSTSFYNTSNTDYKIDVG